MKFIYGHFKINRLFSLYVGKAVTYIKSISQYCHAKFSALF